MSGSDDRKLPDNVITVDFRRRADASDAPSAPRSKPGDVVTLPFGSAPAEPAAPRKPRTKKAQASADGAAESGAAVEPAPRKRAARPAKPKAPAVPLLTLEKLDRFRAMVDQGLTMLTIDSRVEGVDVPREFKGVPRLALNFSHNFRIPDFEYDEGGVRATLSFNSGDHRVIIPWPAVYIMLRPKTDEVAFWEASMPVELTPLLERLRRELGLNP